MDTQIAGLVALGIVALVALAYLAVFRKKAKVDLKGPAGVGVSFEGSNENPVAQTPGSAMAERIHTGGKLDVTAEAGGNARASDVVAHSDVVVRSGSSPKV